MTNRIPLIVNPGAAQIQELAPGDNLDLNGGSLVNVAGVEVSSLSVSGNVEAAYFLGDGSQLTNLPAGNYSNANVAAFLPTYTGNLRVEELTSTGLIYADDIDATGNISGDYFIGNGAFLTGLPAGYGNADVEAYLPTDPTIISIWGSIDDTNSNVANTDSNVSALGGAVGVLTSGLANITANVSNLTSDLANTDSNVANISYDVSSLTSDVTDIIVEIGNINSNVANTNANVTSLFSDLANTDSNVGNAFAAIISTNSNVANTDGNVANIIADVMFFESEVANAFIATNANVANTDANVANISSNVSTLTINLASTNSNVADAFTAISMTNSNVANTDANVAAIAANVGNSSGDIANLTAAIASTNSNVANTDSNVATLTTNLANIDSNVSTLTINLASTNSNVANTNSNVANTNSNVANTNSNVTVVQGNIANLTYSVMIAVTEATMAEANTEVLFGMLANTDSNVASLTSDLANTDINVASLTSGLANTNSNVSNLSSSTSAEFDSIANSISNIEANISTLQGDSYSNANAAAYLAVYDGNILANVITANLINTLGNLDVGGNLNVLGNIVSNDVSELVVGDPLIYIGANNTGDIFDLGIVASYNDGTYVHTGVARNTADNIWTFFDGVVAEPTTVIDWANATYPAVKAGDFLGESLSVAGNVEGAYILGNGAFLTGLPAGYANSNVAAYLPTYTGNLSAGNILITGGILGSGGTTSIDNIKIGFNTPATGAFSDLTSAGIVSAAGNVTGGNVRTSGQVSATGLVTGSGLRTAGTVSATGTITGGNLATTGTLSVTGNTTAGNINCGTVGGFVMMEDYVATGTHVTFGFSPTAPQPFNVGDTIQVEGSSISGINGSFLSTSATTSSVTVVSLMPAGSGSLMPGGPGDPVTQARAVAVKSISITGNVTAGYFIGDGSQLTGLPAGYSNADVANYLPTYTGNVNNISFAYAGAMITDAAGLSLAGNGLTGLGDSTSNINIISAGNTWSFNLDSSMSFPMQQISSRVGSAHAIAFAATNDQAVITGPAPIDGSYDTAPRLIVAGRDGINYGEGGDVYLWAGRGGASGGSGGDIKIDGGQGYGTSDGGYVKIRGGYSSGGYGGSIEITAGSGTYGSSVQISSGQGTDQASTADVTINVPYAGNWTFDRYGNLTTPGNIIVSSGGNILVPGGEVSVSGNITGGGISATGNVTASGIVTQTALVSEQTTANTIVLGNATIAVSEFNWVSAQSSSTTPLVLWEAPISTIASVDFNITVTNETTVERQVTQIIAVAMDTNFGYNEYGSLRIGNILSDLTVDSSAGNLRLLSTPATTDTLDHTVVVQISYDMNP